MEKYWPIVFALATGIFWGTYGPVLGEARKYEGSPFKPYVMIGVAYLVWGIIGGVIGMLFKGDTFTFTRNGTYWGFAAGTLGAFGALSLTLAMFTGGIAKPQIVMPIVFGTAVTVAAIAAAMTSKTEVDWRLYLGIAGMAVCIVTVAYFTPHATPHKPPAEAESSAVKEAT